MTKDELLDLLFRLFEVNTYVEDNNFYIRSALKYDIHNLLEELAPEKLRILYEQLEYNPVEED